LTRYVSVANAAPSPPYTNWATAASNIQDAIDVAALGDRILVTNGTYQTGERAIAGAMSNRVAVTKPLVVVQSVNGPATTVIKGNPAGGANAVRCVYLASGAILDGFTLTDGTTQSSGDAVTEQSGAGVWCQSPAAIVTNCVITGNIA